MKDELSAHFTDEEKREKTVGGLSEACHRDFNTLKYRHGFPNADQLLTEMMDVCELTGLLGNTELQSALKELRKEYSSGAEMIEALILRFISTCKLAEVEIKPDEQITEEPASVTANEEDAG